MRARVLCTHAYNTKMHSQTLRTNTHTNTLRCQHMARNMRQHTESIDLHTSIHWCTHIYMCARTPISNTYQHVRSHTDIQTRMLSITHAYTYTLERVRIVCACVCVCVCVCVFVCVHV